MSSAADTSKKKKLFLKAYGLETHESYLNISKACKASNVPRKTFYNWKDSDKEFKALFEEVEEASLDEVELTARKRGLEKSDLLLIFYLKSKRPKVFGDKKEVVVKDETKAEDHRDEILDRLTNIEDAERKSKNSKPTEH